MTAKQILKEFEENFDKATQIVERLRNENENHLAHSLEKALNGLGGDLIDGAADQWVLRKKYLEDWLQKHSGSLIAEEKILLKRTAELSFEYIKAYNTNSLK